MHIDNAITWGTIVKQTVETHVGIGQCILFKRFKTNRIEIIFLFSVVTER